MMKPVVLNIFCGNCDTFQYKCLINRKFFQSHFILSGFKYCVLDGAMDLLCADMFLHCTYILKIQ